MITHRYSQPGSYSISAIAFFHDYNLPTEARLDRPVHVIEPMSDLSIIPPDYRYALPYLNGRASGKFNVTLSRGSHFLLYLVSVNKVTKRTATSEIHRPPGKEVGGSFSISFNFDQGEFRISHVLLYHFKCLPIVCNRGATPLLASC